MISKLKKILLPSFIMILVFFISLYFVNHEGIKVKKLIDDSFLFTYLSIFLGISITLLTFIASMVDKINTRLDQNGKYSKEDKERIEDSIDGTFTEIKENIIFLFVAFLILIFLIIFRDFDFPLINLSGEYFNKRSVFSSVKLTIFVLSLYTIYDLIIISFRISDATGEIN